MTPLAPPVQKPEESWKGDQTFVAVEVVTLLIGFVIAAAVWPSVMEQVQNTPTRSGARLSSESLQTMLVPVLACLMVVVIPIEIVLMTGVWKGKQWAYVVLVILLLCGGLSQISGFSRQPSAAAMSLGVTTFYGIVVNLGKLIFCGMRLGGAVGPPLK